MCGIVGEWSKTLASRDTLERMSASIIHRGPDGAGLRIFGQAGLAMRRLAIIDLAGGDQPIHNEDESVWVVFNGEIYNYVELRETLEQKGHTFSTHSDTEVIVHLYEDYGERCVEHLRGMFAFALWDQRTETLLLARDRIGKKPLYYGIRGDSLYFGSELKALRAAMGGSSLDIGALRAYVALGYVPHPMTIYTDIRSLPPAHTMTVDASGRRRLKRYWRLNFLEKSDATQAEIEERVRETVNDAVRLRLRSDVPVGVFLSGGMDSGLVTALACRHSSRPVSSFSIGFADAAFNELPLARQVAERYGTDHHEFIVEPDVQDLLPRLITAYDQPYADSSAIPSYHVSRFAAQHVKVVLNGDGGDEAFGGYRRYAAAAMAARIPAPLLAASSAVMHLLPDTPHRRSPYGFARRFVQGAAAPFVEKYRQWTGTFDEARFQTLWKPEYSGPPDEIDCLIDDWLDPDIHDPMDQVVQVDSEHLLPDDLLVKMDIASMANSLEARSPLLDQEVLQLAAGIPSRMKVQGRQTKTLLRQAFSDLLPADVLNAPKRGFEIPAARWLREELHPLVNDILLAPDGRLAQYFRPEPLRILVDEHHTRERDHAGKLWTLLSLGLWLEQEASRA